MTDRLLIVKHASAVPNGTVPEWVHLVPSGTFSGLDGRGPYRLRDPQAVIAASLASGKLPIDENHATDFAMTTGIPSPARGWIVAMEARGNGIWARVEWTAPGRKLMAERAYSGISPVIEAIKNDGTVIRVLRAAMTNTPNLSQLVSLNNRQGNDMDAATRDNLTSEDRMVCERMSLDPKAFLEHKKALSASDDYFGLTPEDRAMCAKMGIDLQEFADWKKNPRRDGTSDGRMV